jgi:hypothetical protein
LFGCTSAFKGMQSTDGRFSDIQKFRPAFTSVLYKTEVNVVGKYLSGLLIIKKMPDSSTRVVFSNEMGITFFDFGFMPDGGFKVFSIVHQMNKKSVIKTLRKDFELILMDHLDSNLMIVEKKESNIYYRFPQSKGCNYYITDSSGNELLRLENASKRKPIVEAIMKNFIDGIPDTIGISHTTFNFTIGLKRIQN